MGKALEGYRILDFTHVQSGPTCTQLLAWFGADVIKVERAGEGDATRGQLRDIPNADSLYFTMLNHNKRSVTIDTKKPAGKEVLEALIQRCDVLVENFAPGALDRMGFTWEHIHALNPRMVVASVKGFGPGKYEDCKVYENVAQCAGGVRVDHRLRRRSADGHRRADRRQRHRPAPRARHPRRAAAAAGDRPRPEGPRADAGRGAEPVPREAARPAAPRAHAACCRSIPQYPDGTFGDAVPRSGNASGGGQPGSILKCKGWETDPNAYIYFITQGAAWPAVCRVIGEEGWIDDPGIRDAAGAAAAPEADLRAHREVDDDEGQVRGDGHPEPVRHPVRSDPVDEGDSRTTRRCARAARSSRSTIRCAASI